MTSQGRHAAQIASQIYCTRQTTLPLIRDSYGASGGVYGAPRVFLDLREVGETCGRHLVARLVRPHQIRAVRSYSAPRLIETSHKVDRDQGQEEGNAQSPVVTCAWCKTVIGPLEGDPQLSGHSHGICSDCFAERVESLKR